MKDYKDGKQQCQGAKVSEPGAIATGSANVKESSEIVSRGYVIRSLSLAVLTHQSFSFTERRIAKNTF
jgi:hypothetical protein